MIYSAAQFSKMSSTTAKKVKNGTHVINPLTDRCIQKNGKLYKKLVKEGVVVQCPRLNGDCWSEVLGFIETKKRFLVAQTNKEIYKYLWSSFTGQKINLRHEWVTAAGLAHLRNVEKIDLGGCKGVTDAGLAHLKNVKVIDLMGCTRVTDAGLAHLENVEKIYLMNTKVTSIGLTHLENVKEIDLGYCKGVTDAGLVYLANVEKINFCGWNCVTDAGKQMLRERGVTVWRRPRGVRICY